MQYMLPWERTAERRGRRKGREQGLEQGREQGIKDTALKMLQDGLPVDRISRYTGLPYEEIEKLSPVAH